MIFKCFVPIQMFARAEKKAREKVLQGLGKKIEIPNHECVYTMSSSLQHTWHPKQLEGEDLHAASVEFTAVVPDQKEVTAVGPLLPQLVSGKDGVVVLDPESGCSNGRTADVSTFAFQHAKGKVNSGWDVSVVSPDHGGAPHSALHLVPGKKNGNQHDHLVSRAVASADELLKFHVRQPNHAQKNAVLFFSTGKTLAHCSKEELCASLCGWRALGVSHIFITELALQKWLDGIVVAQNIESAAPQSASSGARLRAFLRRDDWEIEKEERTVKKFDLAHCVNRFVAGIPNIHVMSGTPACSQRWFAQQLFGMPLTIPDTTFDVTIKADKILYASSGTISADKSTARFKAGHGSRLLVLFTGEATVNGSLDATGELDPEWEKVPLGIPGLMGVGVHDEELPISEAATRLLEVLGFAEVGEPAQTFTAAAARLLVSPLRDHHVWASVMLNRCSESKTYKISPTSEWLCMFRSVVSQLVGRTALSPSSCSMPSMLRCSSQPTDGEFY